MPRRLKRTWQLLKEEKGSVLVLMTLSMVGLLGFTAMVLDVGLMLETRRELQNAVDAAALAGAWDLPENPAGAVSTAYDYAQRNGVTNAEVSSVTVASIYNPNDSVQVTASRQVNLGLAPVIGINSTIVEATATGIVAQVQPQNIWPFGVPESQVTSGYQTMKLGSSLGDSGNFWAVDFPPGGGASVYRDNIEQGWSDTTGSMPSYSPDGSYSWWIDPKTGNMVGPTNQGIDYIIEQSNLYDPPSCILADPESYDPANPPPDFNPDLSCWRIGLVPIISDASWAAATGNSNPIDVVGFAVFYIDQVIGSGGQAVVKGVWLDYAKGVGKSFLGAPLEGLVGARLYR